MNETRKEKLKTAGKVIAILVFGGGGLFFYFLISMLFGTPLYAIQAVLATGFAVMVWLVLRSVGVLTGKRSRRAAAAVAAVLLGSIGWAGYGYYQEQIPTVDDRDLLLYEYEPFREGTKAVTLEEPSTLKLTEDQLLRIDGATALYPVYSGFVQAVYPEGDYPRYDKLSNGGDNDGYGLVTCSNTVYAYERLIEGKTDVIFAAGPSESQLELAKEKGMELHMTPVGREAFVFFVNSRNPVTGLTVEEVQKIYTGEITQWSQVGGPRWSIRPFQRAENSGSQTSLQRLMGDLPLIEPETENRVDAMDGIIQRVASYKNYKNAIGFSFRYYATEMVTSNEIRLLALNGVEPTRETISDGTYPIASEFYAITASPIGEPKPEEVNEHLKAFLDWVVSPQGQSIVEETGYVPL